MWQLWLHGRIYYALITSLSLLFIGSQRNSCQKREDEKEDKEKLENSLEANITGLRHRCVQLTDQRTEKATYIVVSPGLLSHEILEGYSKGHL